MFRASIGRERYGARRAEASDAGRLLLAPYSGRGERERGHMILYASCSHSRDLHILLHRAHPAEVLPDDLASIAEDLEQLFPYDHCMSERPDRPEGQTVDHAVEAQHSRLARFERVLVMPQCVRPAHLQVDEL